MRPAEWIEQRLQALEAAGQLRDPAASVPEAGVMTGSRGAVDGQWAVVDARSNDYLGLARSLSWRDGVSRETGSSDWGAGASRLISGTKAEHFALEAQLSEWLGAESSLLFSSGYAANVGVVSALGAAGDTIFSDALNHASIVDGCRLGRARLVITPHNDLEALAQALRDARSGGALWVVAESYFGMDGDSPDLRGLRQVCDEHEAGLVVDEAHALGIFGPEGRGLCAEAGVAPDVLVGGMGKALGLQGGFVTSSALFREWFWNRARTFVFSTAPSPVLCGVAAERLGRLRSADAERHQLRRNERRLEARLLACGIPLPAGRHGPIFPIIFGAESRAMQAAAALRELGVLCQPIRPPTVPPGGSRIRVTLRADMPDSAVDALGEAIVMVWARTCAEPDRDRAEIPEWASKATLAGSGGSPFAKSASQGASAGRGGAGGAPAEPLADASAVGGSAEPRDALSFASRPRGVALTDPGFRRAAPTRSQGGGGARSSERAVSAAGVESSRDRAAPLATATGARRWVILGTGTEVGKTFVAGALVRLLAQQGRPVAGLKPIETGVQAGGLAGDASRLAEASFHVKQLPAPHPLYAFPDPVAPWLAARRQNRDIHLPAIASWIDQAAPEGEAPLALIIETAGGVFSPLSRDTSNFNLALMLGPATWVLVAPDRLGVLHDVVSTLGAMQRLGRSPDWLVLSATARADASTGTNADELRQLGVRPAVLSLERGQVEPLRAILEADTP